MLQRPLGEPGRGRPALPLTLPDKASLDFIRSAQKIREDQNLWIRNFQLWLDDFQGADLPAKRAWLQQQVASLAGATAQNDVTRREIYAREAIDGKAIAQAAAAGASLDLTGLPALNQALSPK